MIMFKVYYSDEWGSPKAFDYVELKEALSMTETLRKEGMSFVTMVSENPNCVSKIGVDEVKDPLYNGWLSRKKDKMSV